MTHELWILTAAVALGIIQLFIAARANIAQHGTTYAAGARDQPAPPLTGNGGRLERAFRNFLETFPFFAAAVLVAHVAGVHNGLTYGGALLYLGSRIVYVPVYAAGVSYLRTVIWLLSIAGIIAVLIAPLL